LVPGPVSGGILREILFKMDPKPTPRGRGRSPRPLGVGFGSILNRISFKIPPETGPGTNIYSPELLLSNLEYSPEARRGPRLAPRCRARGAAAAAGRDGGRHPAGPSGRMPGRRRRLGRWGVLKGPRGPFKGPRGGFKRTPGGF